MNRKPIRQRVGLIPERWIAMTLTDWALKEVMNGRWPAALWMALGTAAPPTSGADGIGINELTDATADGYLRASDVGSGPAIAGMPRARFSRNVEGDAGANPYTITTNEGVVITFPAADANWARFQWGLLVTSATVGQGRLWAFAQLPTPVDLVAGQQFTFPAGNVRMSIRRPA